MYIDQDGFWGKNFELGNGWFFRIDPSNAGNEVQRHIHVWKKGGPEYAQNADGSPHENLNGIPPKWVRKKLEDIKKWTWKEDETPIKTTPFYPKSEDGHEWSVPSLTAIPP